jgi:hypothetical protein
VVTEKVPAGATYCSLCSRLRRGHLYRIAREEGCEALVLGHHRDDCLETFFMNLFHGGRLSAMPAKLLNDEGDLLVLRPLIASAEEDIAKFSAAMQFPIIPCDLCGSQDGLQRNLTKEMLAEMERRFPGRKQVMMRALSNVRSGPSPGPGTFRLRRPCHSTKADPREPLHRPRPPRLDTTRCRDRGDHARGSAISGEGDIREKTSATDLVTEADEAAERFIAGRCRELAPDALFVGGGVGRRRSGTARTARRSRSRHRGRSDRRNRELRGGRAALCGHGRGRGTRRDGRRGNLRSARR